LRKQQIKNAPQKEVVCGAKVRRLCVKKFFFAELSATTAL
jgi:hypothetical protein